MQASIFSKRFGVIVLLAMATALLTFVQPVEAGFVTKQLTNNSYGDFYPQINDNGWVVWQRYDGHDYEIYLYKGSGSPIQLTNKGSSQKTENKAR